MTLLYWLAIPAALLLAGAITLWSIRHTREAIQRWFRSAVLRAVHEFRVRIDRYKLVSRRTIREELLSDPVVIDAMRRHVATHGTTELDARVRVENYVDEIVPHFNVLTYYRFGYNVARLLVHLLYRVRATYKDPAALGRIPRTDVVVYLMNHRSNADYVVVAYVLARGVSISYAVGEWARVWPLEYVFKSFGAYFVRRRFREPLYHTVLERYVQLITKNGVTQGIFLEGGLSRNGAFRPPKLGLLDYIVRTVQDPRFRRRIWFIPVAINYDRVLEDRTLIQELLDPRDRPGRLRQLLAVLRYIASNLARLVTGRLARYGRVEVRFGSPLSLEEWLASRPGVLDLPKEQRVARLMELAQDVMDRIAAIMPVPRVPLVAAALLSFRSDTVTHDALLDRVEEYRRILRLEGDQMVRTAEPAERIVDRAWQMLRMRRLVVREGELYVVMPRQRPLLEFYANSIRHLLPEEARPPVMHPALEADPDLPALRPWKPKGAER